MWRWLFCVMLMLVPLLGHAQSVCTAGVGAAASVAPAGRGWDLSTPGPWATGVTPALNGQCRFEFLWVGIEGLPLMRHSYSSLGGRGPVLVTASVGSSLPIADGIRAGHYFTSNRAARGFGVRTTLDLGPIGPAHPMLELRAGVLRGLNPTWHMMALLHLGHWDLTNAEAFSRPLGPGRLRHGLTFGTLNGVRAEWTPQHRSRDSMVDLGVRAGVLHTRRSPLQPTALAYAALPFAPSGDIEVSAGATLRKAVARPMLGASVRVDSEDVPVQVHAGALVTLGDGVQVTPDIGASITW